MRTNSIFHHFRPHDEIEVCHFQQDHDMLCYLSRFTGHTATVPMRCGPVQRAMLLEGAVIQIQYGKLSKLEANSEKSRAEGLRQGDQKISGMRHISPGITPLGLSVMRWALGDERVRIELERYADRAATTQRKTAFIALDGETSINLSLGCGIITPDEIKLSRGARITMQGVHLSDPLPETLMLSACGLEIDKIVSHPALIGGGKICQASRTDKGTYIHLEPDTLTIHQALEQLEHEIRKAA